MRLQRLVFYNSAVTPIEKFVCYILLALGDKREALFKDNSIKCEIFDKTFIGFGDSLCLEVIAVAWRHN